MLTLLFSASAPARAEPSVELSGSAGFGVLAAGITPGRFAISPSASLSVRGERGFFVVRDIVSFVGATGGRFGINNETTLGGGLFWERVNVSAGLSLAEYSLPVCGPRLCGQVRGLAPGVGARLDLFGPFLSGGLGVSLDCPFTIEMPIRNEAMGKISPKRAAQISKEVTEAAAKTMDFTLPQGVFCIKYRKQVEATFKAKYPGLGERVTP